MITYLHGTLTHKDTNEAVIECGGVGYDIKIPTITYNSLPELNTQIKMFVHYHHSDDGVRLFGFLSTQERDLFRKLISISHVGPKTALVIISSISLNDLIEAFVTENLSLLTSIPGLGKKTAQRIIIELKDKNFETISAFDGSSRGDLKDKEVYDQVTSALIALGYKQNEISLALKAVLKTCKERNLETLTKLTIKYLYGNR